MEVVEGNGGAEEEGEEVVEGAAHRNGLEGLMIFGGRNVGVVGRWYKAIGRVMVPLGRAEGPWKVKVSMMVMVNVRCLGDISLSYMDGEV